MKRVKCGMDEFERNFNNLRTTYFAVKRIVYIYIFQRKVRIRSINAQMFLAVVFVLAKFRVQND